MRKTANCALDSLTLDSLTVCIIMANATFLHVFSKSVMFCKKKKNTDQILSYDRSV